MAQFEIVERECLKMVRVVLNQEHVRAEAGALHYMKGWIEITSQAPSAGGFLKSMMTGESVFKPIYSGTGEVFFGPPFFGEYMVMELTGEEWILERGAYVCSDYSVEVGAFANRAATALLGGQGWVQTSVKGQGTVVVQAHGAIQRIDLQGNEKLVVDGPFAVARSASLSYSVQKATKSLFGSLTSGEGLLNVFEGTGTVYLSPVPNIYQHLINDIGARAAAAASSKS